MAAAKKLDQKGMKIWPGALFPFKMDIGQVIRESKVEGEVLSKLNRVPLDDLGEVVSWLVRGMKVVLYDCHFNGRRLTMAVGGYIGRQENSNNLRLEWLRTFPEPLQIVSVCGREETFTLSIDEGNYTSVHELHKATGEYLGYVAVVST